MVISTTIQLAAIFATPNYMKLALALLKSVDLSLAVILTKCSSLINLNNAKLFFTKSKPYLLHCGAYCTVQSSKNNAEINRKEE